MEITIWDWINLAGWGFVAMCVCHRYLDWLHGRRSFRDDMGALKKRLEDC